MTIPRPALHPLALTVAALAAGLLVIRLPLEHSVLLFAGLVVFVAAFWEPALGLGLAVLFGPAKALIEFSQSGVTADTGDLFRGLPDVVQQLLLIVPADLGQLFLAVAIAGWLAHGLVRRSIVLPRLPLLLPLCVYAGVGLVSLVGAPAPDEGLKEILKWAEIILVVVIVASECARGRATWLVAAVLAAGAAQAALGYWQYDLRGIGPTHFQIGAHYRAYGTFEQPNPFGGFLGLLWPLAAGLALAATARAWHTRRPRAWLLAGVTGGAALLMLVGLYTSLSRGAWLGAAAAAVAVAGAVPRRRLLGVGLVVGGGLLFLGLLRAGLVPASITTRLADVGDIFAVSDVRGATITVDNFAILERLAHWQAAASMARDHPWLGVGLGNYGAAYPLYSLLNWPNALGHAHNIYLNTLAETGVLGLAAYLILWLSIIAFTMRAIGRAEGLRRGLLVGLLGTWAHLSVHQLVDNLYVNNIHLALAVLLGLLVAEGRGLLPRPPQPSTVSSQSHEPAPL